MVSTGKIFTEKLCQVLIKQYDFDVISLLPTNLFGLYDNYQSRNSHVMAAFMKIFIQKIIF